MDSLGLDSGRKDIISMPNGTVLETHGPLRCQGTFCCIHNPSEHPLRNAPMVWIKDMNLMMRVCSHEHLHPDPDSMRYLASWLGGFDGWHPCCGDRCCGGEADNDA